MVHLEQAKVPKRFLKYRVSSVSQAASKNRGKSCLWESEYSWDYWERVKIEKKFLRYDAKDSMFQAFSQNEELVLQKPCGFRLTPSPCSTICPVLLCLHPQEDDANFFGFTSSR